MIKQKNIFTYHESIRHQLYLEVSASSNEQYTVKTCVKRPILKRSKLVFRSKVGEHSAKLLTFIKLP